MLIRRSLRGKWLAKGRVKRWSRLFSFNLNEVRRSKCEKVFHLLTLKLWEESWLDDWVRHGIDRCKTSITIRNDTWSFIIYETWSITHWLLASNLHWLAHNWSSLWKLDLIWYPKRSIQSITPLKRGISIHFLSNTRSSSESPLPAAQSSTSWIASISAPYFREHSFSYWRRIRLLEYCSLSRTRLRQLLFLVADLASHYWASVWTTHDYILNLNSYISV